MQGKMYQPLGRGFSANRKPGFQSGDKVVDMLQPDGEAQQSVADAGFGTGFRTHVDMGHRRRMRDEAFDAAEGFSERENAHPPHEAAHGRHAAGKFEAHHRAETLLLPGGERMVRVIHEAGVMHARHRRMRAKPFRDRHGVALLPRHAGEERSQAPQRQP